MCQERGLVVICTSNTITSSAIIATSAIASVRGAAAVHMHECSQRRIGATRRQVLRQNMRLRLLMCSSRVQSMLLVASAADVAAKLKLLLLLLLLLESDAVAKSKSGSMWGGSIPPLPAPSGDMYTPPTAA